MSSTGRSSTATATRWGVWMAFCSIRHLANRLGSRPSSLDPPCLGDRVHPRLGGLVRMIERFFNLNRDRPTRIDFTDIAEIGRKVRLRLTVGETEVDAVERRLRHWVRRLPGSR